MVSIYVFCPHDSKYPMEKFRSHPKMRLSACRRLDLSRCSEKKAWFWHDTYTLIIVNSLPRSDVYRSTPMNPDPPQILFILIVLVLYPITMPSDLPFTSRELKFHMGRMDSRRCVMGSVKPRVSWRNMTSTCSILSNLQKASFLSGLANPLQL